MRPSKRAREVIIFVAALLLLCGLSAAQKPNTIDWGKSVDGLQMSVYHEEDRQAEFPKFRVEFRNTGHDDLLLNLGIMSRDGERQYLDAVSLILEDPEGKPQRLELKKFFPTGDAGTRLFLPLPVGATFSFPMDLRDYRAVTSKEFDSRLKPGTYWLAAQFIGIRNNSVILSAQGPGQAGPPILAVRTFDIVNPESALGSPPISNTLRFEVPNR
jgi:hypothetical protein